MIINRPFNSFEIQRDDLNYLSTIFTEKNNVQQQFIQNKLRERELINGDQKEEARICKEMYDYIINEEMFKERYFNEMYSFRAIVWNKLFEIDKDVPGPYNPKEWVPIAKEKLSFLCVICDTIRINKSTNWDQIP